MAHLHSRGRLILRALSQLLSLALVVAACTTVATDEPAVPVAENTPTSAVSPSARPALPRLPEPPSAWPPGPVSSPPNVQAGSGPQAVLEFSGHRWLSVTSGPGASPPTTVGGFLGSHAWVDREGNLNLRLDRVNGEWMGAAVLSEQTGWGYGTYQWTVDHPVHRYHPSTVVGLFTYEPNAPGNREIDIEIARFGQPDTNMVTAVYTGDHRPRSDSWVIGDEAPTTHAFTWHPGRVTWVTRDANGDILHLTEAPTDVQPGDERVHMNLWICCDEPPEGRQQVTISDFTFIPLESGPDE